MRKILSIAAVVAGLVLGGAGLASAASSTTTQTISVPAGETKPGTVSCASGRVTGVSSKSTGAWIIYTTNGGQVNYKASNPTNTTKTIQLTVKCG